VLISDDKLILSSVIYKFSTPMNTLDLDASQVVSDYSMKWRLNGLSVPGFDVGHYKDKEGRSTFLLAADPPYAVVPLIDNKKHHVIFSIGSAENLDKLKSAAQ